MDTRYKVILDSPSLHREISLGPDETEVRVGTTEFCDVRLRRALFFQQIELLFQKRDGEWHIVCPNNLILTAGDERKLLAKKLLHGDQLSVRYKKQSFPIFSLSFSVDFDYEENDYRLEIDLSGSSRIQIGGDAGDIALEGRYAENTSVVLIPGRRCVEIEDCGSQYGVFVDGQRIPNRAILWDGSFFSVSGFSFYYADGKLYANATGGVLVHALPHRVTERSTAAFRYPKFLRNTRVRYVLPTEEIEILPPPAAPKKPRKNLALILIPSVILLGLTILLRGVIGHGGTFVIYSAVSIAVSAFTSAAAFVMDQKEYRRLVEQRKEEYKEYIERKTGEIQSLRQEERRIRDILYESLDNSLLEAENFGRRLFERSREDPDFLQIYLGRGSVESSAPVRYTPQEFADGDPLSGEPERLAKEYHALDNAPIVSDFLRSGGVGIVGSRPALEGMLRNLILDTALRHDFDEVRMACALDVDMAASMRWIRWLRNVDDGTMRYLAYDEESRNAVLECLYEIIRKREEVRTGTEGGQKPDPPVFTEHYVLFVTDLSALRVHALSRYVRRGAELGFTFVFFAEHEEWLMPGCGELVRLGENGTGELVRVEDGSRVLRFAYRPLSAGTAEYIALRLGSVTVESVSGETELPKRLTLFELLGIGSADDLDFTARWNRSDVSKGLPAPIGVRRNRERVFLDISDRAGAHGPHGLVAGTTGSGKSELLQTYVVSLAAQFHPYEVGFVFIDFKGGGMADRFPNLPHLLGTITNIDGEGIRRSLLSINAEMVKRQRILREHQVNHVNDYIRLFRRGAVRIPMPHIIMIVDEFAQLKQKYPDFIDELVEAARIGRTLGIHLILATQKPDGVVSPQILANTSFHICLKVQTREDSNAVLKSPLAAEIKDPGRAYFQVGNNEIFALFQSAYSASPVPSNNGLSERIYTISERSLWGKRTQVFPRKREGSGESEETPITQLTAIVDQIAAYCASRSEPIHRLPGICLPPLPSRIPTSALTWPNRAAGEVTVPIGRYDDPEEQRQGDVVLNLSRQNYYLVGAAQSGKTVLLQTILYGLIRQYTPDQVHLYLIDCGSGVLRIFERSRHVGGVVLPGEEEKCGNLFKLLHTAIAERKSLFSKAGVSSYTAYMEGNDKTLPLMVVVVDNAAAFREYFAEQADQLTLLSREALGAGISLIVTAASSNALQYRTQANFAGKIALHCNDTSEYSALLDHCRMNPQETPGRGLFMLERRILEFQGAIFGGSDLERARSAELQNYLEQRNGECSGFASEIPMVPERLDMEQVMERMPALFQTPCIFPIGMSYETVDYDTVSMNEGGWLALTGDEEAKTRFVRNLLCLIERNIIRHNLRVFLVDDRSEQFAPLRDRGFMERYTSDLDEGLELTETFCAEAEMRKEPKDGDPLYLLILHSAEILRKIGTDRKRSGEMKEALENAGRHHVFYLLSGTDNRSPELSNTLMRAVQDSGRGILFAPLSQSQLFRLDSRKKAERGSWDSSVAYVCEGGRSHRIKLFS